MTVAPFYVDGAPLNRGRWRITLHDRQFSDTNWQDTLITELGSARSRRLDQQLNSSAKFTFTLDGRSEAASLIRELQQDVIVWRWDDVRNRDVPYFRGIVAQTEDELTEQVHIVNVTCHDYIAMMARRYFTSPLTLTQLDQDTHVTNMIDRASRVISTAGTTDFRPGSYLPLVYRRYNPDYTYRVDQSGVLRDRTYPGSQSTGEALDNMAHVIGGFDYDAVPGWKHEPSTIYDYLRIFYPQQGVTLDEPVLEYGGALATVTRTASSDSYANFVRVLGNAPGDDITVQLYSERWNPDSNDVTRVAVGLWMDAQNAADVSVQATLDQTAAGQLDLMGVLIPSYSLGLAPNVYREGLFRMGDSLPVVINSGRLAVTDSMRVVGMSFVIGDDGQEDVELTVGRPLTSLADMFAGTLADVNALARR